MFRPNQQGQLLRKQRRRDIHGSETYDAPVPLSLSVVSLVEEVVDTPIRADSSASRASASQTVLSAKLLVDPNIKITKGDVIQFMGYLIEVTSMHPRIDVFGRLHHLEIRGDIKGDL